MSKVVIELNELRKTYKSPFKFRRALLGDPGKLAAEFFRRPKTEAVAGISLEVFSGEIFGFLGPNGAGKTTTIRLLMGLISATGGWAKIFGEPVPSRKAQQRIGFLPESPYFYDYLTVDELLDLVGRIFGQTGVQRARRKDELIERVGLSHARRMPMKKFSKGMLQRAGLAQALMNDPDLVVFDEPMSGLDPVGRKEVRDIIQSLRDAGKTVFFSSHILADVEMICDRVGIVIKGALHDLGTIRELVKGSLSATEVLLHVDAPLDPEPLKKLLDPARNHRTREGDIWVELGPDLDVDRYLMAAIEAGTKVVAVTPRHETLEDVFIRSAADAQQEEDAAAEAAAAGEETT